MCKTKGVFARYAVSVLLAFAMVPAMFGGGTLCLPVRKSLPYPPK